MGAIRAILYKLDLGGNLLPESRKAVGALKDVEDQARRTSRAGREAGDTWDKTGGLFDLAARKMGGTIGDLGDVVFDLGGALKGVTGTLGGTAGAMAGLASGVVIAAAGAAVMTRAMKEWLDAAVEANARLKAAGLAIEEQSEAIDQYAQASKRLDLALDQVHVTAASLVAGPFADMLNTLSGMLGILPGVTAAFGRLDDKLGGTISKLSSTAWRVGLGTATLGLSEAARFGVNLGASFWGSVGGTTSSPAVGSISKDVLGGSGGRVHVAGPSDLGGILGGDSRLAAPFIRAGQAADEYGEALRRLAATMNNPTSNLGGGGSFAPGASFAPASAYAALAGHSTMRTPGGGITFDSGLESAVRSQGFAEGLAKALGSAASGAGKGLAGLGNLAGAASSGGLGGVLSMFGPVGAGIGALVDHGSELPDLMRGLVDQFVEFVRQLPGILIDLIPILVTELVPALVKGIADAIVDGIRNIFGADGRTPADRQRGGLRRLGATEEQIAAIERAQAISQGSVMQGFATGVRWVPHDMTARLHRGERVETATAARARERDEARGGRGGVVIGALHLHGVQDVEGLVRELRRRLGSLGNGLSLEALV